MKGRHETKTLDELIGDDNRYPDRPGIQRDPESFSLIVFFRHTWLLKQ
jgi:hypothetical protein